MIETQRVPCVSLDGDYTVVNFLGRRRNTIRKAEFAATDDFISGMRNVASGVVLVTTWIDNRPWGLTISSFVSVSVKPPRVLISLQSRTASCLSILETNEFGACLLHEEHRSVAEDCSKPGTPKFFDDQAVQDRSQSDGPPRLMNSFFHMDCRVEEVVVVGDHTLFVGGVRETVLSDGGSPLVYTAGSFHAVGKKLVADPDAK